jgi:hypothetical protein
MRWQGPGWYWCGYAYRTGLGWGGGYEWNGWRHPATATTAALTIMAAATITAAAAAITTEAAAAITTEGVATIAANRRKAWLFRAAFDMRRGTPATRVLSPMPLFQVRAWRSGERRNAQHLAWVDLIRMG